MSIQVEAWYRERYLSKVTHKYKHGGFLLKGMITPPAEMDGKKLYFPVSLPGKATKTKRGDKVKTMNAGKELKEVVAERYEAAEYVYKFDINKTAAGEMETNTKNAADALGQAHDSVIMGKVHAGAGTYGTVIGANNAAWNLAKALEAETALRKRCQNPKEFAFCCIPVLAFQQMMTFQQFSNSQYVGSYPLAEGVMAKTWGRTHYIQGYDEMFPTTGGTGLSFYYWFQQAIGSGDSGGIDTDINYVPTDRGWLHDNTIEIGATVLLTEAIQECKFDNASAITFS
jgi:hypothetical protein